MRQRPLASHTAASNRSTAWFFVLSVILSMLAPLTATAAIVTWRASGYLVSVNNTSGAIDFAAAVGQAFSLEFSFDPATADTEPSANYGLYDGALTTASLTIGATTVFLDDFDAQNHIVVVDDFGGSSDIFDAFGQQSMGVNSWTSFQISLLQLGSPPAALDNVLLPLIPPNLADFSDFRDFGWIVRRAELGQGVLSGTITSFEDITPVPLPAAAWLLVSGLVGLGAMSRRRHVNV